MQRSASVRPSMDGSMNATMVDQVSAVMASSMDGAMDASMAALSNFSVRVGVRVRLGSLMA